MKFYDPLLVAFGILGTLAATVLLAAALGLALALPLAAQNPGIIAVGGDQSRSAAVQVVAKTTLAGVSCAWLKFQDDEKLKPAMEVGDVIPCTVTASQKVALNQMVVWLSYAPNVSGPGYVVVKHGELSATFSITALEPAPVALLWLPISVSIDSGITQHYASLVLPCCARADLCGLPLDQVAQEPCLK